MSRITIVWRCANALDKPLRSSPLTQPTGSLCSFLKSIQSHFVYAHVCVRVGVRTCVSVCVRACAVCVRDLNKAAILLFSVRAKFQSGDYVKG